MWASAKKPLKIRSVVDENGTRQFLLGGNGHEKLNKSATTGAVGKNNSRESLIRESIDAASRLTADCQHETNFSSDNCDRTEALLLRNERQKAQQIIIPLTHQQKSISL